MCVCLYVFVYVCVSIYTNNRIRYNYAIEEKIMCALSQYENLIIF